MKLLFVTDNGFSKLNNIYYYSAPNYSHIAHLSKFFDSFIVIARKDSFEQGYSIIPRNVEVNLIEKNNIIKLNHVINNKIAECDAVICYGNNGYFASKIGRRRNKVVISYNGGDPYDFLMSRGTLQGKILAPIAKYMCKKSFENSDFGHYCDEFLFDRYPANGDMLACSGVNIECDDNVLKNRINKINQMNNSKIKIGLIGHTKNSLKGIDLAIKLISELGKNFSLEIVGRGEYHDYEKLSLDLGCSQQIKFLGTLSQGDQLFSWLDTLDIYIQPSRIEGLPRATIEAMSRACPIICSNAGALAKLINSDYIFINEDVQMFKSKIELIMREGNMIKEANSNFQKAKTYDKSHREKKYDDFYSKVIKTIKERA